MSQRYSELMDKVYLLAMVIAGLSLLVMTIIIPIEIGRAHV